MIICGFIGSVSQAEHTGDLFFRLHGICSRVTVLYIAVILCNPCKACGKVTEDILAKTICSAAFRKIFCEHLAGTDALFLKIVDFSDHFLNQAVESIFIW